MRVKALHGFALSLNEARQLQLSLANSVSQEDEPGEPHFIAGIDVSAERALKKATAAVVVLSYPEMNLAETALFQGELNFPYIPGFLSFREAPLVLKACEKLSISPELIIVDGQGIAHPRRFGIASHLGLFLDTPTIGCAKSLLCGTCEMPAETAGSFSYLVDHGEVIGAALRTKAKISPVFVSVGHKVSLGSAISWVMKCCRGQRLPEPMRLAHLAAGGQLKKALQAKFGFNLINGKGSP